MRRILIFIFGILIGGIAMGQYSNTSSKSAEESFHWPEGKTAAVSLTFDDARPSQLDNGVPILDKYDVNATFYASPDNMEKRVQDWQTAAENGHEIGNHSNTHPCTGNFAFSRDKALENHSLQSIAADIELANERVEELIGVKPVTFAYPCGQTFVGRGVLTRSYVPVIAENFLSGRLWLSEDANHPVYCDLAQVLGVEFDGMTWDDLKPWLEKARQENVWLVLAGHDIGVGGRQTVLTSTLERLCRYAGEEGQDLWITTVESAARYISDNR